MRTKTRDDDVELTDIAQVANLDVFTLYSLVSAMAAHPDRDIPSAEIAKMRNGISLKFDLLTIKSGRYTPKMKANRVIVNGEIFALDEFEAELEERKQKGIELFLLGSEQKDIIKSR